MSGVQVTCFGGFCWRENRVLGKYVEFEEGVRVERLELLIGEMQSVGKVEGDCLFYVEEG